MSSRQSCDVFVPRQKKTARRFNLAEALFKANAEQGRSYGELATEIARDSPPPRAVSTGPLDGVSVDPFGGPADDPRGPR